MITPKTRFGTGKTAVRITARAPEWIICVERKVGAARRPAPPALFLQGRLIVIPYVRQFDFTYGHRDQVSPLIQRVIADNPGPFTFTGTGTYIVGRDMPGAKVAVIDPGPDDEAHLHALLRAVKGRTISHILVTHTHRDHAPLARPIAEAVGGPPILAARPPGADHPRLSRPG